MKDPHSFFPTMAGHLVPPPGSLPVLLVLLCCLLAGCGSWRVSQLWETPPPPPPAHQRAELDQGMIGGSGDAPPLVAPQLPPGLSGSPSPPPARRGAAAASGGGASEKEPSGEVRPSESMSGLGQDESGDAPSAALGGDLPYKVTLESPDAPELLGPLRQVSLLVRLASSPPDGPMGLEFRIDKDVAEAGRIMQAYGYYNGSVRREMDLSVRPARVTLRLEPGPLYHMGRTAITYTGAPTSPDVPRALTSVGLPADAPAVAGDVQDAVNRIPDELQLHGYPLAKILRTRYVLDTRAHTLCAFVDVDPGPRATMGRVRVVGTSTVKPGYFARMRPWEIGQLWDAALLQEYRDALSQQGLFRTITMEPVPAEGAASSGKGGTEGGTGAEALCREENSVPAAALYDVLLTVADAPQKTVGAGLNYESDRGVGGQVFWENRNMFSEGELLRAEATLWQDRQDARIRFRKPAFLQRGQDLTAEAWMRGEDTDAYKQRAVWAGAGLERRFGRHWRVSLRGTVEGGELKDPLRANSSYTMGGLPLTVRYDDTGSLLNPVSGVRGSLTFSPYAGKYGEDFTAGYTRLDLSAYYPLLGPDKVVLAARVGAGSLLRDDAWRVPASIRYYVGGGGSVRGYAYQSLGPRDKDDKPLGGASFLETGLEARIKITKDIGLVPFIDGGNAYASVCPDPGRDGMQWGAGLGLRYYTAIGPIRLDVATPLNPRSDDTERFFVYISIGQSF